VLPRNAGEIYQQLVDVYMRRARPGAYDYQRVLRPVLAHVAYQIFTQDSTFLACDDRVLDELAMLLDQLRQRYEHRRRVMPDDWSAEGLLNDPLTLLLLDKQVDASGREVVTFAKAALQDYFAAIRLVSAEHDMLESVVANSPNAERWFRMLAILLGIHPNPAAVLDTVHRRDPNSAIDLWFEHRPSQAAVPAVITAEFERAQPELGTPELVDPAQPEMLRLLTRLLERI